MANHSLKIRVCWGCRKQTIEKLLVCGGCKTAYYCNAICQQNDWSNHENRCGQVRGDGQLRHRIDNFAKSLSRDKIPKTNIGYIIQIKNSNKFLELVDGGLDLSAMPLVSRDIKHKGYTVDKDIFVSFAYNNMVDFIENYRFILYLMDMLEDITIFERIIKEHVQQGKPTLIIYSHDIKHYTLHVMKN
jgi:hypothetical protein